MDILEKFEIGRLSHTYRRIDSDYKVNIFLGYNEEGQMSFVITEPGVLTSVKSSKMINVSLKVREDKKLALTFDLLDDSFKSLFIIVCKDIIVTCEKAGGEAAISTALLRWKYWKELFGQKKKTILDKNAIKGLIGELIALNDLLIPQYGVHNAINCWRGPILGHKDFEIDSTWYETKAVSENALQIVISSLEQLDSEVDGHLLLVRLEETSMVNSLAINLNVIATKVSEQINDPEDMDLFISLLRNAGYEYDPEYDSVSFLYKGMEMYLVDDRFPRIQRSSLNNAIGNANYTIILEGISSFREA